MFSKENFSLRLVKLRKEKGVSQVQLGEAVGISQFAVSKIEKGERAASIEVIYALADYFNVSLDYLVGRSSDPKIHK